ncbi:MAG: ABC transporter substrate-binding protein, partial [Pseudomonadota bacterium]
MVMNPNAPRAGALEALAAEARAGRMDRREFVALASVLGASAAGAYGMLGLPAPARADEGTPVQGGTLRVAMLIKNIADPRKYDWPEMANVARQFCETLVRWEPDFTFSPQLLESWEVSEDARTYTLKLRQGVTWTNGDAFTAEDVVFNIARWCDKGVEGNSMATAMASLIDAETGQLAEGAAEIVDEHTVVLNLPKADISLIPAFSDYPALIVHRGFDEAGGDLATAPIGTGPFELEEIDIGVMARVKRRENGAWWGGAANFDAIEFIDFGTDPTATLNALEAEDAHVNDETPADLIEQLDAIGLVRAEKETAQTIVARMNVNAAPYDDVAVRRAIQQIVSNQGVMALGVDGRGLVAENHHVGPMHPEYADIGAPAHDVQAGVAAL